MTLNIPLAACYEPLFAPHRYKVYYGGRGGGKSWGFADALLLLALRHKTRVLCARELQTSIAQSVHRLLSDRINFHKLDKFFIVQRTTIQAVNGSDFIFLGLRHNISEIKSLEGVNICWVEEAQRVSRESWEILIPTIRKESSEIWISFNPRTPYDETWQRFVDTPPPDSVVRKVTWRDNPWMPETLEKERAYAEATLPPEDYACIWEGVPRVMTEAQVFANRYTIEAFDAPPPGCRHYLGADWGFANDPTAIISVWLDPSLSTLYVDFEAWEKGINLESLPEMFARMPDARRLPIWCDAARPEIIRYIRRQGFPARPAPKWSGSVMDGVDSLRALRWVVHPRCIHTLEELRLYSYKQDPLTEEILPALVDKNNHLLDAARYALTRYIRGKTRKAQK